MKTSFYLTYGIKEKDINLVKNSLVDIFGFEFKGRESDYYGEYYQYDGFYADKIIIYDASYHNLFCEKSDYHQIIEVFITSGKMKDRRSKLKWLKKTIGKVDNAFLIKESDYKE